MGANGPDIVKRNETLKNEQFNFLERWDRMAPFIAPSREGIQTRFTPGTKQGRQVFDSSTMMAAELSAHFIAGHVINPGQQWMNLRMRQSQFNEIDEVREWLEEVRDRMLSRFASSMFYAEAPEALIDYVGFGTANILIEELPQPPNEVIEGFRGFNVQAVKIGRYVMAEGADGLVDTMMREHRLTVRNMRDLWGEERLSESVKSSLVKGEFDKQIVIIHSIQPRLIKDRNRGGALGFPWESAWVEKEAKHLIRESGFTSFPGAVARYQKTPGEVYGRGRGDLAFADTWTLNMAKRMGLEDWALKIRPPVLSRHDSVIGTLRLTPGGPMSVNTHGQRIQDVIAPFETGSRPEVSAIKEEELRKSIRQIFFVDQILALMEVQKTEMTAFEFAKKIELLFRLLGPVYGRMEFEFLRRIIDISFDIMIAAGDLSPPPDVIFESNGEIDVEFQNPIAKAQRAGDVEAITLAVNDLAPLAQMFPEIWDGFDPDKLRAHVFQIRGVPAKVSRNEEEIEAVREARQQQQEQEQQLDQAQQGSEILKNVTPALVAGQQQRALRAGTPEGGR
jgi:hypothetical protein